MLCAGTRLGVYEIVAPLGSGGMGEVYRARDTRLDRTVAVKVLPFHIAARQEFRQRFEREARAVSALNHPHICVLHDVGEQDGIEFMVMEHLEGETLASRLKTGPLPVDEAITYADQLADAVDRAHRSGVVHRDLKPGNIMLTRDGIKVLDFGLAKTNMARVAAAERLTLTAPITGEGTILGTPEYMSPEQIEGLDADARSDIFAFGCVLYEMITGRRAFGGKTHPSIIASILAAEPQAMKTLQPLTPQAVEKLVKRCLAKNPENRYQSLRDVALDLRAVLDAPQAPASTTQSLSWRWAAITAFACAIALVAGWILRPDSPRRAYRYSLFAPEPAVLNPSLAGTGGFALSPDGTSLVFSAWSGGKSQLWLRRLEALESTLLQGTDGAYHPFWSPDSRSIAFFTLTKLMRIEVAGSAPRSICDAELGTSGTWSDRGVILFSRVATAGILRVPAAGGTPTVIMEDDARDGTVFVTPSFLPDGSRFLYGSRSVTGMRPNAIFIARLDDPGNRRQVLIGSSAAVYAPPKQSALFGNRTGFLLYVQGGVVMAQAFDPSGSQLHGDPMEIGGHPSSDLDGVVTLSASATGSLAYQSGDSTMNLVWRDRSGRQLGTSTTAAAFGSPSLSPDGKWLAYGRRSNAEGGWDIWVADIRRGTDSRLTVSPSMDIYPVWSPTGAEIVYSSITNTRLQLFRRLASGAGEPQQLTDYPTGARASDWSGDGRFLLFHTAQIDLIGMHTTGEKKAFPVVTTPFVEVHARFSPAAGAPPKWFAYASDLSGTFQIYAQAFLPDSPASGARIQISTNGGMEPRWRGDGRELYYLSLDGRMMAVAVNAAGPTMSSGTPTALFQTSARPYSPGGWSYDVTRDGQRFIFLEPAPGKAYPITMVVNWQDALPK